MWILPGMPGMAGPAQLRVSPDHRHLQYRSGEPFFYLGDTAWELFHRLDREEADQYLTNRANKGFTVIQAVVLAELDGLKNALGSALQDREGDSDAGFLSPLLGVRPYPSRIQCAMLPWETAQKSLDKPTPVRASLARDQ